LQHCPHCNGGYYPAMTAPIVNIDGHQIGLSATFLEPNGTGKWPFADKPLQCQFYGSTPGGSARLAQYDPSRELVVGEGVENVLSAMQLFDLPGWAALSSGGIKDLDLPDEVRGVVIAIDNDWRSTGQDAALFAHNKWTGEGRAVRLLLPPDEDMDFNDVLMAGAHS
jgi:hypothetical protein